MLDRLRRLFTPRPNSDRISFSQAVDRADSLVYGVRGDYNNRASAAVRHSRVLPEIERYLDSRGWGRLGFVGAGDNVFVLQIDDQLALRVRGPVDPNLAQTKDTPVAPHVLPVLEKIDFGEVRLNVVPFVPLTLNTAVRRGTLNEDMAELTMNYLLHRGFKTTPATWFWDRSNSVGFKWEQVGFLDGVRPVIVDTGSVIYLSDAPKEASARLQLDQSISGEFERKHPDIAAQSAWTPLKP